MAPFLPNPVPAPVRTGNFPLGKLHSQLDQFAIRSGPSWTIVRTRLLCTILRGLQRVANVQLEGILLRGTARCHCA